MIDLKDLFGGRYRIEYEASGLKRRPKEDDIALQLIPCEHGHIFAWSDAELAASLDGLGGMANRLGTVVQDGDDGITVTFPPERMPAVAQLMRPRLAARSKAA